MEGIFRELRMADETSSLKTPSGGTNLLDVAKGSRKKVQAELAQVQSSATSSARLSPLSGVLRLKEIGIIPEHLQELLLPLFKATDRTTFLENLLAGKQNKLLRGWLQQLRWQQGNCGYSLKLSDADALEGRFCVHKNGRFESTTSLFELFQTLLSPEIQAVDGATRP